MDKWLEMDDTLPEMHIWYVCERRGALMHVTKLRKKKDHFKSFMHKLTLFIKKVQKETKMENFATI